MDFLFPFALYTKQVAITSKTIFYLSLHSLLFNNNFKSKIYYVPKTD